MLPCVRSLLRRRGLALLRGCAEGECGRGEALANARRVATLAGLGGRRRRLGRCADPPPRVGTDRLAGGWRSGAQTRCFLGCGDGEEGSMLSKVYEQRRVMGALPSLSSAFAAASSVSAPNAVPPMAAAAAATDLSAPDKDAALPELMSQQGYVTAIQISGGDVQVV